MACLLSSPLGCKDTDAADRLESARKREVKLEKKLSKLKDQVETLTIERDALVIQHETEQGCRKQVIGSLTAYGGPEGPHAEVTARVAAQALTLLERRVAKRKAGEKLAIVLDVDETALDNFEQLKGSGFCFVREQWDQWVKTGKPEVVAGMKRLYDYARAHKVAVVFITGRREHQREATERVLRAAGFDVWEELVLRDEAENELTAAEYKSGRRAKLEERGFKIALTLGDQASDLAGGHAEHAVLMPNPFYHVD
ncbi:Acid phosphatase, class B [Enhygromyxa salina]|uniref:Acid phosphatase, class B n=1 Tax=Enhygromyxa salina TaxID=215803 RepID=A0A0C1ZQH0_9BACT|nr:HAD family acid phosphatase [Enhygromyxa salina]KIG13193.1 Acid phosphatase, class B [Enhygromyxa salina]